MNKTKGHNSLIVAMMVVMAVMTANCVFGVDSAITDDPGRKRVGIAITDLVPKEVLQIGSDSAMNLNVRLGYYGALGLTGGGAATILGGNVKASTTLANRMEYIRNGTDGGRAIEMVYSKGIVFHTSTGATTSGNAFSSERMRITPQGNVGIGTTNPAGPLDVRGFQEGQDMQVRFHNSAGDVAGTRTTLSLPIFNGAEGLLIRQYGSSADTGDVGLYDAEIQTRQTGSYLHLGTQGRRDLSIHPNGSVGIGTAAPRGHLELKGSGSQSLLWVTNTNKGGVSALIMAEDSTGGSTPFYVERWGSTHAVSPNMVNIVNKGAIRFAIGQVSNDVMRLNSTAVVVPGGKRLLVGIDTAATENTHALQVQGGILTDTIKANYNNWADHVFEPDYPLMPLDKVETFIRTRKHLPGIPSAEEMLKNPNELPHVDRLLIEKIEEMMLYILELKKENVVLRERIKLLEDQTRAGRWS